MLSQASTMGGRVISSNLIAFTGWFVARLGHVAVLIVGCAQPRRKIRAHGAMRCYYYQFCWFAYSSADGIEIRFAILSAGYAAIFTFVTKIRMLMIVGRETAGLGACYLNGWLSILMTH